MGNSQFRKAFFAAFVAAYTVSAHLQPRTTKAVIFHEMAAPICRGTLTSNAKEGTYRMLSNLTTELSSVGASFPILYFQDQRNTLGSSELRKITEISTVPVLMDVDVSGASPSQDYYREVH